MSELTVRQAQVLAFIRQFMQENESAPTYQEIADAMGFNSPNASAFHAQALVKKGAINIRPGRSRGIVLNDSVGAADFDTWLSRQPVPIEVDCVCVTTEVLFYWVKKAYSDGLRAGAGKTEVAE
jgi:SOS-response transcriptional repressor LexA